MIDTRAVAQEVQDQLVAAVNKSQERFRKAQDQVREAQEQVRKSREEQLRKGREAVSGAIRTGNELARAFRPNIPALPVPGLRVPSLSDLTDPAKLRASAQELADQIVAAQRKVTGDVFASQRKAASEVFASQRNAAGQLFANQRSLADKAIQAAGPFVTDSVARLSKVVATLQDGRKPRHSGARLAAVPTIAETAAKTPAEHAATAGSIQAHDAVTKPTAAAKDAKVSKARTEKAVGAKPGAKATGAARRATGTSSRATGTTRRTTGTARTATGASGKASSTGGKTTGTSGKTRAARPSSPKK
jgi:hypothetical protein